jgi:hypothetical protein
MAVGLSQRILQDQEQPLCTRKGRGHGSPFTEQLLPAFDGHATLGRADQIKELIEPIKAMGWEIESADSYVQIPPQDPFCCGPQSDALKHLLD